MPKAEIGEKLGVTQQAVAKWLKGIPDTTGCNGNIPSPMDCRVTVPKAKIGEKLGVDRSTVSKWLSDIPDVTAHNGNNPSRDRFACARADRR